MKTLEVAVLLGAVIVEKHFTHDKTLQGNDHYHAMDKDDLKRFLKNWERTKAILGKFTKVPIAEEAESRLHARRSLIAARAIPAGKKLECDDLTFKRPAHGISPKYIEEVVGQTAISDMVEDEVLQWSNLSKK